MRAEWGCWQFAENLWIAAELTESTKANGPLTASQWMGTVHRKVRPPSDPKMATELHASLEVRNRFHTYVRHLNFNTSI